MAKGNWILNRSSNQSDSETCVSPKLILALALGSVLVIVCLYCFPNSPPVLSHSHDLSARQADDEHPDVRSAPAIQFRIIRGAESPAPPPMVFNSASPSDEPDLTSPASAVFSVLDLIDRGAMAQLPRCFMVGAELPTEGLFPAYLGHPIALVDVNDEGETALVTWNATVQAPFSLDGITRTRGESVTLTTRLVRTECLWLLEKFHE